MFCQNPVHLELDHAGANPTTQHGIPPKSIYPVTGYTLYTQTIYASSSEVTHNCYHHRLEHETKKAWLVVHCFACLVCCDTVASLCKSAIVAQLPSLVCSSDLMPCSSSCRLPRPALCASSACISAAEPGPVGTPAAGNGAPRTCPTCEQG